MCEILLGTRTTYVKKKQVLKKKAIKNFSCKIGESQVIQGRQDQGGKEGEGDGR